MLNFMAFYWHPKLQKSIPSNLGSQFATLGTNVPAFINILTSMFWHLLVTWGPNNKPKMLKVGLQVFSALTPSVKRALITLEDFMSKTIFLSISKYSLFYFTAFYFWNFYFFFENFNIFTNDIIRVHARMQCKVALLMMWHPLLVGGVDIFGC
jgi:hypothetical protein